MGLIGMVGTDESRDSYSFNHFFCRLLKTGASTEGLHFGIAGKRIDVINFIAVWKSKPKPLGPVNIGRTLTTFRAKCSNI
jgi:hypothetical protein